MDTVYFCKIGMSLIFGIGFLAFLGFELFQGDLSWFSTVIAVCGAVACITIAIVYIIEYAKDELRIARTGPYNQSGEDRWLGECTSHKTNSH